MVACPFLLLQKMMYDIEVLHINHYSSHYWTRLTNKIILLTGHCEIHHSQTLFGHYGLVISGMEIQNKHW